MNLKKILFFLALAILAIQGTSDDDSTENKHKLKTSKKPNCLKQNQVNKEMLESFREKLNALIKCEKNTDDYNFFNNFYSIINDYSKTVCGALNLRINTLFNNFKFDIWALVWPLNSEQTRTLTPDEIHFKKELPIHTDAATQQKAAFEKAKKICCEKYELEKNLIEKFLTIEYKKRIIIISSIINSCIDEALKETKCCLILKEPFIKKLYLSLLNACNDQVSKKLKLQLHKTCI